MVAQIRPVDSSLPTSGTESGWGVDVGMYFGKSGQGVLLRERICVQRPERGRQCALCSQQGEEGVQRCGGVHGGAGQRQKGRREVSEVSKSQTTWPSRPR